MRCTKCRNELPYNSEIGNKYECLFCGGTQVPSAKDLLSLLELKLVTEIRPNQIAMAELVDQVLLEQGTAVIEAGTGVGKSFAYLLPAILSGKRTVISTAKKSLQDQLIKKDLPYLHDKLKNYISFNFTPAYGKNNYACQREVFKRASASDKAHWTQFFKRSLHGHWDDAQSTRILRSKSLSADNCDVSVIPTWETVNDHRISNPRAACAYADQCGYLAAKIARQRATIVIANHWITGYHLKLINEGGIGLFGKIEYLIIDEAHKYEDGIRRAFTKEIKETATLTLYQLYDHAAALCDCATMPKALPYKPVLKNQWDTLFAGVRAHAQGGSSPQELGQPGKLLCNTLEMCLGRIAHAANISKWLDITLHSVRVLLDTTDLYETNPDTHTYAKVLDSIATDKQGAWEYLQKLINKLHYLIITLKLAEPPESGALRKWAVCIENMGNYCAIQVAPVDTSIYAKMGHSRVRGAIYTSATLAVNKNLDIFNERTGLINPTTAQFGSAFDINKQARLYLSKTVPLPTRKSPKMEVYRAALASEIADLITANEGNAFVLFTARDEMEDVYTQLQGKLKVPIVMQGIGNAAQTLQSFRDTPNAAAFGLKSLWEGVDIIGDKLSLVIISKLPFPGRSDPIMAAKRAKAGTSGFHKIDLPDMILDLRQGTGRLIRTKTDRGVIAILDSRIRTKPYGRQTLRSLGFAAATTHKQSILTNLSNLAKQRI